MRRAMPWAHALARRLARESEAIAIAEFAITLPIMLVLAIGIFDFGAAFNLKQKLNATVREAARFGSTTSITDMGADGNHKSVTAIRDLVDAYLQTNHVNDCGLGTVAGGGPMVWTYTGAGCGGGTLTLTIDRGNASFPATIGGATINVISTQVTIAYPYQWQFSRVIGLASPNATYAGTSLITTSAMAPNME